MKMANKPMAFALARRLGRSGVCPSVQLLDINEEKFPDLCLLGMSLLFFCKTIAHLLLLSVYVRSV